jgi:cystathionine beta-synthase
MPEGSRLVVLLPDTGRNYMSKIHSDTWMKDEHFLVPPPEAVTCGRVLASKRITPLLVSVRPDTRACDIARTMSAYEISHVPVTENGMVLGIVDDASLLDRLHRGEDLVTCRAAEVMRQSLPSLDENESIERAYRLLGGGFAGLIVTREGSALGFLSRSDLVDYWSNRTPLSEVII